MIFRSIATFILCSFALAGQQKAKNVIVFLGDAGGLSTLSAGSIYGYGEAQKLYIQRMPHIGLSDTSSSNSWVTDSAAGMSAIMTGMKTHNQGISITPDDKSPVKTLLEYAEQQGLSTGVVTNMSAADATPAACYAHSDSRKKWGYIFSQVWKPRFGDGVDVVIGGARQRITDETKELGFDIAKELAASGRGYYESLEEIPTDAKRVVMLSDKAKELDIDLATKKAIQILSRNPKGYFLMVEWDLHPTNPEKCMKTVVSLDKLIERTAKDNAKDTLVLFTADHSFDIRLLSGKKGDKLAFPEAKVDDDDKPIKKAVLTTSAPVKSNFGLGTSHAGEEVVIAAEGPGSERVRGFMHNTDLFKVMMDALGWKADE